MSEQNFEIVIQNISGNYIGEIHVVNCYTVCGNHIDTLLISKSVSCNVSDISTLCVMNCVLKILRVLLTVCEMH